MRLIFELSRSAALIICLGPDFTLEKCSARIIYGGRDQMIREVVQAPDGRWTIDGHEEIRTDDITLACYVADELYQARGRLNESPKENWVDKVGGLPDYIDRIAVHLVGKGMERGHAIATAVNAVKKACATGDLNYPGVQIENAGSQAEACAAVAEWEAKKAKSHAGGGKK